MKSLLPLLPFVIALTLVACQGDDGPVAEDAVAPPDNVVGDLGAEGLAAPANAAAAEAADRAAAPVVAEGFAWTSAPDGSAVTYGPRSGGPMLRFACEGTSGARQMVVTRFHPATPGATATLSFTGSGNASSLPARAVARPGGPGESEWQSRASGDMARAVARAFAGQGKIDVTLGGAPALAVTASPVATAFFRRCI